MTGQRAGAAADARASGRKVSWDVVRVVAVFSVVIQHATHTASGVLPWLDPTPFTWSIQAGANTLMMISAYFVCVTIARRKPASWWWHRISRLLPAYLVAVLVTYGLTLYAAQFGYWRPSGRDLVGNLLLLQGFDSQVTYIDHSYWTLPAQLAMFTLAALCVGRARFWRRPTALPTLAWALVVGPLVVGLWVDDHELVRAVFDGLVVFRWQLFGMGLALWLWTRGRLRGPHLAVLLLAGALAENVHTPDVPSMIALGIAAIAICLAAAGPDWDAPLLRPILPAVTWLAGISFGIYLVNQQIGYFVAWGLGAAFGVTGWTRLAAVVATAVLLGWALTALVERPMHRLLTPKPAPPATPGVLGRARCELEAVPPHAQAPRGPGWPAAVPARRPSRGPWSATAPARYRTRRRRGA